LQNFKNEIMDDLDDFMSEVDSGQVVKLPDQFDEVVEIVAQEQRNQAERIFDISESGATPEEIALAMEEVMKANEGNQFWQKFLEPQAAIEYKPIAPQI